MSRPCITVAFGTHRLECLPGLRHLATALPHGSALALEEPADPGFADMLAGRLDIAEYLMGTDPDFPRFAAATCQLCRELTAAGLAVRQEDPYMEALLGIHERFADGGTPDDIPQGTLERVVYEAERHWSAALLHYYRVVAAGPFERAVAAVQAFARADAARGRLRDNLRAQALRDLLAEHDSLLVEAGHLHHALLLELKTVLPAAVDVRPVWLQGQGAKPLSGRRQILGPDDVLTLLYSFCPTADGSLPQLLAARSLLHTRLQLNAELEPSPAQPWPHAEDEAECARLLRHLSLADCADLFPRLKRLDPAAAKAVVRAHAGGHGA